MRAAPGRAAMAPRSIARISRRVCIAVLVRPISSRSKVNSALNPYGTARLVTEERSLTQVARCCALANAPLPLLFEGRRVRPSRFPVPLGNGAPGRRLGSVRYALPLAPLAIGMPRVLRGHAPLVGQGLRLPGAPSPFEDDSRRHPRTARHSGK
jgi:hypothetical protein